MQPGFVETVMDTLLAEGVLPPAERVLAVCAGIRERDLLAARGFSHVLITNLEVEGDMAPFAWSRQDAQKLGFEDRSFDVALVVAGLHHCSPLIAPSRRCSGLRGRGWSRSRRETASSPRLRCGSVLPPSTS